MKTILFWTLQLLAIGIFAQSPKLINYQGVARDGNGNAVKNKTISLKFELRQGSATAGTVFSEQQLVTTNNLGLFSTQIGKNNGSGLSAINWQAGSVFLQIGLDTTNSNTYVDLGVQQLVSVPYAMHAESIPASYAGNVLTIGNKSFTLSSASSTIDIQQGNNVNVNGAYPNYTISSTPTLTILAPNTLSISNGNTVDISPPITYTNNILTLGAPSNSVLLQTGTISVTTPTLVPGSNVTITGIYPTLTISATPSLTLLSPNTLSISYGNSITIAPTLSLNGNVLSVGPVTNTIVIPGSNTPTILGAGMVAVTPSTGLNFTVSVPNPTLSLTGNSLSINGGNTVSIPTTSLSQSGAVAITTLAPNSFSLHVAQTNVVVTSSASTMSVTNVGTNSVSINIPTVAVNGGTNVTISGSYPSYTVSSMPTLTILPGNLLQISGGNSVLLPTTAGTIVALTTSLQGSGAASVYTLGANNYSINVAPTSVAVTSTLGPVGVSSPGTNSFNINIPPSQAQTSLTGAGAAVVTSAGTNTFNVTVPQTSVAVTSTAGVVGISSAGTNSFNINIPPSQVQTSVTGAGAAVVTSAGTNTFNVSVPQTSVAVTSTAGVVGITSAGTNSFNINIPPAQAQTTVTGTGVAVITSAGTNTFNVSVPQSAVSGSGVAVVTSAGTNTFNVTVAQTSVAITSTAGVAGITSAGTNSFNINIPPATVQTSVTGTGVAVVTSAGTNTFNVSVPQSSVTGAGVAVVSSAGTNSFNVTVPQTSVAVTSTAGVAGITSAGTNSFNINIPPATVQTSVTGTGVAVVTSAGTNTFNVSVPQSSVTGAGVAVVSSAGTNSFNVTVPQTSVAVTSTAGVAGITSAGTNSFNINIPPATVQTSVTGTGVAVVTSAGTNTFNVTVAQTSVAVTSTAGVAGITSAGTNSFNINIPPATVQTSVTGTGVAVVTSAGTNTFNVTVAQTSVAVTSTAGVAGITSAGTNSFNINIPPATVQTSVTGTGVAVVTSAGTNTFNVTVAQTSVAVTSTAGAVGVTSVGTNSFNINVPPAPTVLAAGIATVSAGPNYLVGVPSPVFSTGSGVTTITGLYPNYTINSPVSNTINAGAGITVTGGPSYTISAIAANTWSLGGNVGTNSLTSFVGTTDGQGLTFRTNNTNRMMINASGFVGLNTTPDPLTNAYAMRILGDYGPGKSAIQGYRLGVSGVAASGGSSWSYLGVDAGVKGATNWGNNFTSGVAGYSYMDFPNSAAVIGAEFSSASTFGALSFRDINSNFWGLYSPNNAYMGGNLAIGTLSPGINTGSSRYLTVSSGSVYTNATSAIEIEGASIGGTTAIGRIDFNSVNGTPPSANIARIAAFRAGSTAMGVLAFSTHNGTTLNEQMRIDETGRVGIGTNAPTNKFEVSPGTAVITNLQGQSSFYQGSNTGSAIYAESNSIGTSAGTTIYGQAFLAGYHNNNPFGANIGVWGNATGVGAGGYGVVATQGTLGSPTTYAGFAGVSNSGVFMGGHVGIGTTAPSASLHVNGSTRLVDGTQGADKVLVSDASGNATWKDNTRNTGFHAYSTVGQTILASTWTQIAFGAEELDSGSDFATNAYVAPTTGVYHFDATVSWSSGMSAGYHSFVAIYKNGVSYKYKMEATNANYHSNEIGVTVPLAAGDVITVWVVQFTLASTSTYVSGNNYTYFSGFRLY